MGIYDGVNDWNSINEPRKTKIDRSATTLIKIHKSIIDKKELEGLTVNNLISNLISKDIKILPVTKGSQKLEGLTIKKESETINARVTSPNADKEKLPVSIEDPEFL